MKFFSKLTSLIRGEETRLFEKIREHVQLSINALTLLVSAECSRVNGDCVRAISELEKKGDEIAHEINEMISRGALSIPILNLLGILVHKLDDILDGIHVLSRELLRLTRHSANIELISRVREYVVECGNRALQSLEVLRGILDDILEERVQNVRKYTLDIEKLEEEVDELKDKMLEYLYGSSGKITFVEFYSSISITYLLDDILDRTKDVAELMLLLVFALT